MDKTSAGVAVLAVTVAAVAAAVAFALQPVCVPLDADALTRFDPPVEQRTDRDFGLRVFRHERGQWYQCKRRVSRWMFF